MKTLTDLEVEGFLQTLAREFDVRAPVALPDGTRSIRNIAEGSLSLCGGRVPTKPTGVFFPQCEEVFSMVDGAIGNSGLFGADQPQTKSGCPSLPAPSAKRVVLVGLTAEDANCLEFTDTFFSTNYRDQPYFDKRDGAIIVVVSGRCGRNGEFLRMAGGKCDLELVSDGTRYIAVPYTPMGCDIEARMPVSLTDHPCPSSNGVLESLLKESNSLPNDDRAILQEASDLIRAQAVPDSFWEEIASRCIACTACNMVCPTCTCFEVVDTGSGHAVGGSTTPGIIRRQRLWDSCQLDGFAREASGHSPMGTETLRTRRRIHHKLAADVDRWGHMTCYLCGRCDDACPSGIGMKAVAREIVKRFGAAITTEYVRQEAATP